MGSNTVRKKSAPLPNEASGFDMSVHPLEWVAGFLQQIEGHLGRIADALEEPERGVKAFRQLQSGDRPIRINGIARKSPLLP